MIHKILILFFLTACAQVTSLNLTKHKFAVHPRKIIWFQIAGLKPEHLALLKFDFDNSNTKTSFESFLCYGSMWEYDLYKLRPQVNSSFNAQVTGKSNITNSCKDLNYKPIWSYLDEQDYRTALFQTKESEERMCDENKSFYANLIRWKMERKVGKMTKYFHSEKDDMYEKGNLYYDRACLTGKCFNNVSKNIISTFERFEKNSKRFLYQVQDYSYHKALKQNNLVYAKRVLAEIDISLKYFQKYSNQAKDVLVLVTGANALDLNFPKEGKEWEDYLKKGKHLTSNESELLSPVMAMGARSENFCGIYNQGDLLARIFSGAKQQGLELEFINPFK